MKWLIALLLCLLCTPTDAHAENVFSVTLPTSLQIKVDKDGKSTVDVMSTIVNNSTDTVAVTKATITPAEDWKIVSYYSNFRAMPVNTKHFGFLLQGLDTADDGTCNVRGFTPIKKDATEYLYYELGMAPQLKGYTGKIADLTIVMDWADKANPEYWPTLVADDGSLVLSAKSISLTYPQSTTVSVTYNKTGGFISASCADENMLDIKVNGSTITLTPLGVTGNTEVLVKAGYVGNEKARYVTLPVEIIPKLQNVTCYAESFEYDGEPHAPKVVAINPSDAVFTYSLTKDGEYATEVPTFTEKGSYTVYVRSIRPGYETYEGLAFIDIY